MLKQKIEKLIKSSAEVPNNVLNAVPAPMVSVNTITYQHAPYIRECIEGVLMQKTDFPFEYIIGEDCCTDGTREIVLEYAKKYPDKIRVVTARKNAGMMGNVVRCIWASRGKYIAPCEGDDYWTDPYKLQKQVDFMEKNPDVVITYHDSFLIDGEGNSMKESQLPEGRKRDFTSEELKTGIWILTQTMCYRNLTGKYPDNLLKVYNGDTFLTSFLGNYGSGAYLSNINPSCYRINQSGVFSMKAGIEQKIKSLPTSVELMKFYKQRNDKVFYTYFVTRTQKALLEIIEQKMSLKNKKKLALTIIKVSAYLGLKNSLYYLKKLL